MLKVMFFIRDHWVKILLTVIALTTVIALVVIITECQNHQSEDVGKVPVIRGEPLQIVSSHDCPPVKPSSKGMKVKWKRDGLEFSCEIGYKLEGNTTISCQTDGQWSAPVPHCVQAVKSIKTEPTTPQPHALDSCIFNISQKMSPRNKEPSDCKGEMGHQLVNNSCLMVNRACTSCQELFRLTGKFHIGNQTAKTRLTCCLKMKVCQEMDWCNGGEMICETAHGNPVCNKCRLGYTGDRCQEILPPAKVKCTWTNREIIYMETPNCLESWLHNSHEECVLQGKNKSSYVCKTNQVTEEDIHYCELE